MVVKCTFMAEVKGLIPVLACLFSGLVFATAKVSSIPAMIFFHIILLSAFLIYGFHIFISLKYIFFIFTLIVLLSPPVNSKR